MTGPLLDGGLAAATAWFLAGAPLASAAAAGFVAGLAAARTGVGAGLAWPLLVALGWPAAASLLAIKLPLLAGDVAALARTPGRSAVGAVETGGAAAAGGLAIAGACGACLWSIPGLAVAVAAVLVAGLWTSRARAPGSDERPAARFVWALYVGGCGIGLWWLRHRRPAAGVTVSEALPTRRIAAFANAGACAALLAGGAALAPLELGVVAALALGQATGAMAGAALPAAAGHTASIPRTPSASSDAPSPRRTISPRDITR